MTCTAGHPIPSNARFCSICGAGPISPIVDPVVPVVPHLTRERASGFAVAALVLGIISVLSSLFLIGLPFGVLAIVFGGIALSRGAATSGRGLAIAGLVLGAVGLLGSIILITALIVLTILGFDFTTIQQSGVSAGLA